MFLQGATRKLLCYDFFFCVPPTKSNTHCAQWRATSRLLLASAWARSFICVEDECGSLYSSATGVQASEGWFVSCLQESRHKQEPSRTKGTSARIVCFTCVCGEVWGAACPISPHPSGGSLCLDCFHPGQMGRGRINRNKQGCYATRRHLKHHQYAPDRRALHSNNK